MQDLPCKTDPVLSANVSWRLLLSWATPRRQQEQKPHQQRPRLKQSLLLTKGQPGQGALAMLRRQRQISLLLLLLPQQRHRRREEQHLLGPAATRTQTQKTQSQTRPTLMTSPA